jgi:hypothetical protein
MCRWALTTIRDCLGADWDPALLEHEMAEEVAMEHEEARMPPDALAMGDEWVVKSAPGTAQQPRASPAHFSHLLTHYAPAVTKTVLLRGLRLRVSLLWHFL